MRFAVGTIAVAATLLVSSCANIDVRSDRSTSIVSTPAPRFRTTAEAEGAARTLYEKYLATTDSVSAAGGSNAKRLQPFVTAEELKEDSNGAQYLKDHGLKIVGKTKLVDFQIQSKNLQTGAVDAYACVDFSDARVVDRSGKDVTPKSRTDKQTSLARFVWGANGLLLNENGAWSGSSIC